jgi:hypothetical protein
MNKAKNLFGFFMAIAILLVLVSTVSAATTDIADIDSVKINGIVDNGNEDISVIAGEMMTVEVIFTAIEDASDVRIEVELEGEKDDSEIRAFIGDLEEDKRYTKTLTLKVPYELNDEVSEDMSLNLKIWNGDYKTEHPEIVVRVQRPSYNAQLMSVSADNSVTAGDLMQVDVVLKNIGYNELEDLYLTTSIPALGLTERVYAGDLTAVETDDDDDFLRVRTYLRIPYDAAKGTYTLEVEARNSDFVVSDTFEFVVNNDFEGNLIVADNSQTFNVGEEGTYELIVVNPTNSLKVYRIVVESPKGLDTSASEYLVAVPAGLSKNVRIYAEADSTGEYGFEVNVLSGENLVGSATLRANVDGSSGESAIIVLTIILIIVFLVLLGVLIVLLRKKPKETEEFGESYY